MPKSKNVDVEETTITETLPEDRELPAPKKKAAPPTAFKKGCEPGPGRRKKEELLVSPYPLHDKAVKYLEELVLDTEYRRNLGKRMREGKLTKEVELFMLQRVYGVPPTEQRTTKKIDAAKMTDKQLSEALQGLKDIRDYESGIGDGRAATA